MSDHDDATHPTALGRRVLVLRLRARADRDPAAHRFGHTFRPCNLAHIACIDGAGRGKWTDSTISGDE